MMQKTYERIGRWITKYDLDDEKKIRELLSSFDKEEELIAGLKAKPYEDYIDLNAVPLETAEALELLSVVMGQAVSAYETIDQAKGRDALEDLRRYQSKRPVKEFFNQPALDVVKLGTLMALGSDGGIADVVGNTAKAYGLQGTLQTFLADYSVDPKEKELRDTLIQSLRTSAHLYDTDESDEMVEMIAKSFVRDRRFDLALEYSQRSMVDAQKKEELYDMIVRTRSKHYLDAAQEMMHNGLDNAPLVRASLESVLSMDDDRHTQIDARISLAELSLLEGDADGAQRLVDEIMDYNPSYLMRTFGKLNRITKSIERLRETV